MKFAVRGEVYLSPECESDVASDLCAILMDAGYARKSFLLICNTASRLCR